MKNISSVIFLILPGIAAISQTAVQPTSVPVTEVQDSNLWDTMAMVIAATSVSALLFYLIYLLTGKRKYFTKRKK